MSLQSSKDGGTSHKRPLDHESEQGDQLAFVISQESVMASSSGAHEDHEASLSNKRQRTLDPDSPGVVSIGSTMGYSASAPISWPLNEIVELQPQPMQWWKQAPTSTPTATSSLQASSHGSPMKLSTSSNSNSNVAGCSQASSCFICKRPCHETRPTQQHTHDTKPSNSLLSYFPSMTKVSSSTMPSSLSTSSINASMCVDVKPPPQPHAAASVSQTNVALCIPNNKCSFCDRQACPSCTRQCEQCQHTFCSLCSTTDYSGRLERTFCLDCSHANKMIASHEDAPTNDDGMQIG